MSDGYEAARLEFHPKELSSVWPQINVVDMSFLSADSDMPDLVDAVVEETKGNNQKMRTTYFSFHNPCPLFVMTDLTDSI